MVEKKTIWIIGASSGVGRSLAIALARQGHNLILSGRRAGNLESIKADYIPEAKIIPLDITNQGAIKDGYDDIKKHFPFIDSVILMSAEYHPMTIDNLDLEKCRNIVHTNLLPAFTILHTLVPDYKARGQGQIILCGSVAGYRGLPNGQPYSATKAALINLAETSRIELQPFGIDVKIINPGFVKTDMTAKNTFSMPMLISPELAAERIVRQMFKPQRFEIKTHPLFSLLMGFLKIMPFCVYSRLVKKMT